MNLLRNRLMAAVTGKKSILPEGYTQVEYLHIWGTTYIDMGINPREQRDDIEIEMQFVGSVANVYIGHANQESAFALRTTNATPSALQCRNSGTYRTLSGFTFDTSKHLIGEAGRGKSLYADNVSMSIPSSSNNYANNNYRIGGHFSNSYTDFNGNIFVIRYKRDGALVRNVIPCRDADGKGYAYDSATKSFRTISGSNVEPGPDVV